MTRPHEIPQESQTEPNKATYTFPALKVLRLAIQTKESLRSPTPQVNSFFTEYLTKIAEQKMTGKMIYDAYTDVLSSHEGELGIELSKIIHYVWFSRVVDCTVPDLFVRRDSIAFVEEAKIARKRKSRQNHPNAREIQ